MRLAPLKRLLDIISSATLLVLLSPVILIVAIGVWIDLGRPLLFRQQRPGLHGRPFTLVKFRTMGQASRSQSEVSTDEERLTRFGRGLRSTSLDEIPELWNVLRGDMSLVGPRPLLMHYLPLYTQEQMRRHDVRPGLTGWAQVNGRNALSWEDKFKLDVWYVDNQSILLDLRILLLTAGAVLRSAGIAHAGCATMPEFKGTPGSDAQRKAAADAAVGDYVGE
jgi:lipopolysaccharide/colanic/teichoic acid biosynthesis glycosyltransferase